MLPTESLLPAPVRLSQGGLLFLSPIPPPPHSCHPRASFQGPITTSPLQEACRRTQPAVSLDQQRGEEGLQDSDLPVQGAELWKDTGSLAQSTL